MKKNYGNIPKWLKFLNKCIALEPWYTMENFFGTIETKQLYYGKNMVLK